VHSQKAMISCVAGFGAIRNVSSFVVSAASIRAAESFSALSTLPTKFSYRVTLRWVWAARFV